VKFLIDRCAGHRLAEWLRAQGHDVVESRERGPDPGDRVLLEWAGAEDRILVAMDKDFGVFIFLDKAPHCGIIRLPDVPADRRIQLMKKVLKDHCTELLNRAIVTVRGGRIRVSHVS
jgi:predicted nuclease of predicted toxin-antitoxin system